MLTCPWIASFWPMAHPLVLHLDSAALAPISQAQTVACLNAAGASAFTCDLADLAAATLFLEAFQQFALLGVECTVDLRAAQAALLEPQSLDLIARHRGVLLLRLTSSDPHDKPSAPRAMPLAAASVTQLARQAAKFGVAIALDHRAGCWMQRAEDAVRVAMRVNRADVGVLFNYGHWHEVDGDFELLRERIKLVLPKLFCVTLPVLSLSAASVGNVIMKTGGPLDVAPLMQWLTLGGYSGPLVMRVMQVGP